MSLSSKIVRGLRIGGAISLVAGASVIGYTQLAYYNKVPGFAELWEPSTLAGHPYMATPFGEFIGLMGFVAIVFAFAVLGYPSSKMRSA